MKKGEKFGGGRRGVESSLSRGSGGGSSLAVAGMGEGRWGKGWLDCRDGGDERGRKDIALSGGGYMMG